MSAVAITYNSYNMQDDYCISQVIHSRQMSSRRVDQEFYARADNFKLFNEYFTQKEITISGVIMHTSVTNLMTEINLFKTALQGVDKNLDINYGDGVVRYTATCTGMDIPQDTHNITFTPFRVVFLCHPLGKSTSLTTITQDDNTETPFSDTIAITGNTDPKPIITLTFTDGNNVTAIKVDNTTTSTDMTITRGYDDAEILVVDCGARTVEVDDTAVDFIGIFPTFDLGNNTLTITVTNGGAFDIDMDVTFYPSYL